ncbi:hypothetical protein EG68_10907 [Paragonimus skrjabini miyazakii]|uniref:Replication factor C C-terminal domain-containing protein n=1 Tax=Paragonimus skrjabini miyazakii TaxID=59628 RepID=A0A8S9YMB6_9TREM|nr:hypothetical protein EG68_10907 [Paragonimus skrjabini miyazakii]
MLQSVCQLWNSSAQVNGAQISKEQLDDVAAVVPNEMILGLMEAAQSGRFDDLQAQIKTILLEGHSAHQTIYQLHSLTIESDSLADKRKALLLEIFALADSRLMDGADEYLQLLYVGGGLMRAFA